jgi:hypothetical protein
LPYGKPVTLDLPGQVSIETFDLLLGVLAVGDVFKSSTKYGFQAVSLRNQPQDDRSLTTHARYRDHSASLRVILLALSRGIDDLS